MRERKGNSRTSSALWGEGVWELACHLAPQRNSYVGKGVRGSRVGSSKFKDGRRFLIFFSSLPGLCPLPSAAWTQKCWGRRMESPMFSVIYKLVDPQFWASNISTSFFLLVSALESKYHYLATHASTHGTPTFYQKACSLWQIFRRKGFLHRFSSLWELWDSAIPRWQKTSLLSNTRPCITVPALKM